MKDEFDTHQVEEDEDISINWPEGLGGYYRLICDFQYGIRRLTGKMPVRVHVGVDAYLEIVRLLRDETFWSTGTPYIPFIVNSQADLGYQNVLFAGVAVTP